MITESRGTLTDVETGELVSFDINPEVFSDEKSTEFASIDIPGMSHPRIQYTGGGERTLSFSVSLHHGVTNDIQGSIRCLQAWLYAEYSGGRLKRAPHRLLLAISDTWQDELWVMRSCSVIRKRFDKELNCVFAEVALELIQIIDNSIGFEDIRG